MACRKRKNARKMLSCMDLRAAHATPAATQSANEFGAIVAFLWTAAQHNVCAESIAPAKAATPP
jgi:hypothetical protein